MAQVVRAVYGLELSGFQSDRLQATTPSANGLIPTTWLWDGRTPASDLRIDAAGIAIELSRDAHAAWRVGCAELEAETLVHPVLGAVAAVFAHWEGRLALHGGAVAGSDGAWIVCGDKFAGKSTALAAMAAQGCSILSDDVTVVADGRVHVGPRCVDLRAGAVDELGLRDLPVVRGGQSFRMSLRGAPLSLPVAGSVVLEWGPADRQLLRGHEKLRILSKHVASTPSAAGAEVLLDVAAKPMWRLKRPQTSTISATAEMILDCVGHTVA